MNKKELIERMANGWFKELIKEGIIESGSEFMETLRVDFPELKFSYNADAKFFILLTELN
jgi:hypothetical protein